MTGREFAGMAAPSPDVDETIRQQWQLTFELTSHGIAVLDPRTGCMEQVNPAFARMHGGVPEDFTGRQIATTLTGEWQERVPEIVRTIKGRGSRSFDCDRVRRDGSTFPTTTEVVAARGPDGDMLYRLVFVTDLTEVRAREAARAAQEQLQRLDDHHQIAHNLHDNAIQHLFAIGMAVQSIAATLPDCPQAQMLERTLEDIDNTIRGIRGAIYALRPGAVSF